MASVRILLHVVADLSAELQTKSDYAVVENVTSHTDGNRKSSQIGLANEGTDSTSTPEYWARIGRQGSVGVELSYACKCSLTSYPSPILSSISCQIHGTETVMPGPLVEADKYANQI